TWLDNGKVICADDLQCPSKNGRPVGDFPELVDAIGQRRTSFELQDAEGRYVLWVPIWLNDKVGSCLEIINPTPYGDATRHMLEGILCVYRNYQSLLDYSERDSLTGLLNRKTFDEKFSRLLTQSQCESALEPGVERRQHTAEGVGNWLAVVDIDHFKRVNDRFGHLYGDEVLILVANLLRQSFHSQDRVFRFGGEEFVVLLRGTTLHDARRI